MAAWFFDLVLALALTTRARRLRRRRRGAGRRRRASGRRRAGDTTDGGGGGASNRRRHAVRDSTATESQDGHCDILEAVAAATPRPRRSTTAPTRTASRASSCRPGATYPVRKTLRLSGATEIGIADGASGQRDDHGGAGVRRRHRRRVVGLPRLGGGREPDVWLRDVTLTQAGSGLDALGRVRHEGRPRPAPRPRDRLPRGRRRRDLPARVRLRSRGGRQSGDHAARARLADRRQPQRRARAAGSRPRESGATVFVAHSAIVNNASDNDGGGIYLGGGWGTDIIQGSTISGNTTSGVGGGVLVRFAEMTNTYVNILDQHDREQHRRRHGRRHRVRTAAQAGPAHDVSVFASIVAGNYSHRRRSNGTSTRAGAARDPPGVFNCVNGSFIYVAPGYPRPTDMGGARSTFATRSWARSCRMGGEGNLPLHPLLRRQPGRRRRAGRSPRATSSATPGSTTSIRRTPADWTLFDPLVDGDGDGTAVRDLGAYERNDRWQTELLAVRAQGPSAHTRRHDPGRVRPRRRHDVRRDERDERVRDLRAARSAEAGRYDVTIGARTRRRRREVPGRDRRRSGGPMDRPRDRAGRLRGDGDVRLARARSRRRCSRRRARSWCASR